MLKIAIIVALPDEWQGLKRVTGPWRKVAAEPCRTYVYSSVEKRVTLIESGMGAEWVRQALAELEQTELPDLILSCGFAGALSDNNMVGQVCVGNRLVLRSPSPSMPAEAAFDLDLSPALLSFCRAQAVWPAPIVTVEKPQPKALMAQVAAGRDFLMDMESYFVGEFAHRLGIPLLCLRAVSDGSRDEIDFDLDAITDTQGRVSPLRVLRTVLRRPRLAGSFYRSWGRSRRASQRLGEVLSAFLNLSPVRLRELLLESHLFERKQT